MSQFTGLFYKVQSWFWKYSINPSIKSHSSRRTLWGIIDELLTLYTKYIINSALEDKFLKLILAVQCSALVRKFKVFSRIFFTLFEWSDNFSFTYRKSFSLYQTAYLVNKLPFHLSNKDLWIFYAFFYWANVANDNSKKCLFKMIRFVHFKDIKNLHFKFFFQRDKKAGKAEEGYTLCIIHFQWSNIYFWRLGLYRVEHQTLPVRFFFDNYVILQDIYLKLCIESLQTYI